MIAGWVAAVVAGLVTAGVGVFFAVIGVEDADQWSGILGLFVGVAGLVVAVYGAVLTRRSMTSAPASPTGGEAVHNTISGGTFRQSTVQARDIDGLSIGTSTTATGPPSPPAPPPVGPGSGTGGGVRNTISGGTFAQPAVQARDIDGLVVAPSDGATDTPPRCGPTP